MGFWRFFSLIKAVLSEGEFVVLKIVKFVPIYFFDKNWSREVWTNLLSIKLQKRLREAQKF